MLRFLSAAVLLVLAGCSGQGGADGEPPRIVLPEEILDLGVGSSGEELAGTFSVKNAGRGPLHISGLEPGCDCAGLAISRQTIPPGEEAVIQVRVRIKEEGQRLQFLVRIFSDDPAMPLASYTVRAEGAPPVVRVEPGAVHFGEVALGTSPLMELRVQKPDGTAWPAEEGITVESANGQVVVETLPTTEDQGTTLAIHVRPRSDLPLGPFADSLTLRPAGSSRQVQVAVQGEVVPKVVVSPTTLFFGDVDSERPPMQRRVQVRRTDGQSLGKLVRYTAPLQMQIEPLDDPPMPSARHSVRLQVTLDPALVREDLKDGLIELWLENEPEPVTVRVMVFLSRNGPEK